MMDPHSAEVAPCFWVFAEPASGRVVYGGGIGPMVGRVRPRPLGLPDLWIVTPISYPFERSESCDGFYLSG